jgi:hypothetical protein
VVSGLLYVQRQKGRRAEHANGGRNYAGLYLRTGYVLGLQALRTTLDLELHLRTLL